MNITDDALGPAQRVERPDLALGVGEVEVRGAPAEVHERGRSGGHGGLLCEGCEIPRVVGGDGRAPRRRAAARRRRPPGSSAPISSASQAASAAGSLASGAGRLRAAVAMCDGAQTERWPDFSAQSSSVRVAATPKRGSRSAEGPGRLLDREEADAAPGLGRRRADGARRAPRQSTSGWPQRASASRQSGASAPAATRARGRRCGAGCRRAGPRAAPTGRSRGACLGQAGAHDLDAEGAGDAVELLDRGRRPARRAGRRGSRRRRVRRGSRAG